MRDLLKFILEAILADGNFEIKGDEEEGGFTNFEIVVPQQSMGLVIGKNGRTIKAIRNLLKVRATIEKKGVNLSVTERV